MRLNCCALWEISSCLVLLWRGHSKQFSRALEPGSKCTPSFHHTLSPFYLYSKVTTNVLTDCLLSSQLQMVAHWNTKIYRQKVQFHVSHFQIGLKLLWCPQPLGSSHNLSILHALPVAATSNNDFLSAICLPTMHIKVHRHKHCTIHCVSKLCPEGYKSFSGSLHLKTAL